MYFCTFLHAGFAACHPLRKAILCTHILLLSVKVIFWSNVQKSQHCCLHKNSNTACWNNVGMPSFRNSLSLRPLSCRITSHLCHTFSKCRHSMSEPADEEKCCV